MTWICPAYGEEAAELGAVCFFSAELFERSCTSEAQCQSMLTRERQRIFARINEKAAEGDEDMVFIAEQFTSPDQLLGGPGATGS